MRRKREICLRMRRMKRRYRNTKNRKRPKRGRKNSKTHLKKNSHSLCYFQGKIKGKREIQLSQSIKRRRAQARWLILRKEELVELMAILSKKPGTLIVVQIKKIQWWEEERPRNLVCLCLRSKSVTRATLYLIKEVVCWQRELAPIVILVSKMTKKLNRAQVILWHCLGLILSNDEIHQHLPET